MRWVLLFFCGTTAFAATPGSWIADDAGITLNRRGVVATAKSLLPPAALPIGEGRIIRVGWRYQLLTPAPDGLQVRLCTAVRCLLLDSDSGETRSFAGEPGQSDFHFVYQLTGRGAVYPPLRVVSHQVQVDYR